MLPYDSAAALWHGEQRARLEAPGLRPGFADGQIAAIAATQGAVTLRQLNRRCGPLTGATTAQILALLDFQRPADLSSWLAGNT